MLELEKPPRVDQRSEAEEWLQLFATIILPLFAWIALIAGEKPSEVGVAQLAEECESGLIQLGGRLLSKGTPNFGFSRACVRYPTSLDVV